MSVHHVRAWPCPSCGQLVSGRVVASANPNRHVGFREQLADRTFHRFVCSSCDHVDVVDGPMLWTDVVTALVAYAVPRSERFGWRELELQTAASLCQPVRDQGPAFVRDWGRGVAVRLVFGLEELRDKVIVRQHGLRDSVVEVLKLPYGSLETGVGPVLESVDDAGLHFAWPAPDDPRGALSARERAVDVVPWREYEQRVMRARDDADSYPGLFDGTWIHWARAPIAPIGVSPQSQPAKDRHAATGGPP